VSARYLLIAGLLAGMLSAGYTVVRQVPAAGLPGDAVARVGERLILRDEWLKAVAAAASERRTPLTARQQQQILDRLIDEELLVQHGLSLGLVQHDQRLRGQLVSEVLFTTTASVADEDDAALAAFYAEHPGLFVPPAQLRVQAWVLSADGTRAAFLPPVPDSLLPLGKLQAYLGPELVHAAMTLPVLEDSAPISSNGQRVVLRVLEQQLSPAPAFAQVREQVRREVRRRSDEQAVQTLLDRLQRRYRVEMVTLP